LSILFVSLLWPLGAKASTTAVCDTHQVNGGDQAFLMNLNTPLEFGGTVYNGNVYVSPKGTMTFGQGDYTFWDFPATPSISIGSFDYHAFANGVMWGAENNLYVKYGSTATSICVDWKVMLWGQSSGEPIYIRLIAEVNPENYTWTPTYQVSSNAPANARYGVRYTQGGEVFPLNIQTITTPPEPAPEVPPAPSPSPSPTPTPSPTPEPSPEPSPTPEVSPTPEPSPSEPEPSPTPIESETPSPVETPTPTPSPSEPELVEPVVPPTTPVVPEPEPSQDPEPVVPPATQPVAPTQIVQPTAEPVKPVEPSPEPTPSIVEPKENSITSAQDLPVQLSSAQLMNISLASIVPTDLTEEQAKALMAAAFETFETAEQGSAEYNQALVALFVASQQDDIILDESLAAIPLLGDVLGGATELINFLGNAGADMSPAVREDSEKIVITAIVAVQAALSAISISGIATTINIRNGA
jgi:hypothetical protein